METLLRLLNARTFLAVAALVALVLLVDRFGGYPRVWYEARQDAGERGASSLSGAIARDLDARESAKLKALHRAVSDEIAAAQAKGLNVANLQAIADKALGLDDPRYRHAAMERLNQVRLAVPQVSEVVVPATDADDKNDIPAAPKATKKRRAGAR